MLGLTIAPRSLGTSCPVSAGPATVRGRGMIGGLLTLTRMLSNHALPVTSSRPSTSLIEVAFAGTRAAKAAGRQSKLPASSSAAGQDFPPGVTIGAMNFTPFQGWGFRLTSRALMTAEKLTK